MLEYATIAEVHHPDYLSEDDLGELYAYDEARGFAQGNVAELKRLLFSARQ